MSQKQNKKNTSASKTAPSQGDTLSFSEAAARVREQIAGQHSQAALQMAKDVHKRCGTAESESLLVEAYQARIDGLLKLGMMVEAKALMGIVNERFPAAAQRLASQRREIHALEGNLDAAVGPLGDPNLPAEDRERIESFIRRRIHDLPALAAVSSLPPEHSLRVAAAALATAFKAVTEGRVEDGSLALPEVSRRSPLGPWKALARAIASYYRREDEECRKWLRAIADDSVPARSIPAMTAMCGGKAKPKLSAAEEKLVTFAGDHGAVMRPALAALERAFATKKQRPILEAARAAITAADRCDAKLRERLRQHILVRGGMLRVPLPSMQTALGGRVLEDAYYLRLLARALEEKRTAEADAEAAMVWEKFRAEAIKENWFAAGGLEDGVLALHVARMVERLPEELVEEMRDRELSFGKQGKGAQAQGLPSAGMLYERAAASDPHPEAFQMWLNWARKRKPYQIADHVAERWRLLRPTDVQPLLYLMESAEKRSAFKKSLGYLEAAEKLDRLNPEVRRAKLRLLLSTVIRHLRQRKTHLALGGIEQIEGVPEVRPGEIAALAAALRWCMAEADGDKAAQKRLEAELTESMGSVSAHLLIAATVNAAEMKYTAKAPPLKASKIPAAELLAGAVKACMLGEWAGLAIALPQGWNKPLIAALHLPTCPLDAAQMLTLGEAALRSLAPELAYNVSSVGLGKGQANAGFLFLRARSLPRWAFARRSGCFTASLELARRERNTELAGRILDALNPPQPDQDKRLSLSYFDDAKIASRAVSQELLDLILEEEKQFEQFPIVEGYRKPKYAEELNPKLCDCPKCRAKRGEGVDAGTFLDDDDDDWEDDEDFDDDEFDGPIPALSMKLTEMLVNFLGKLPPEVATKVKAALAAGEDPITAIERIMKQELPKGNSSASSNFEKKGRAAKIPPPPEQGSLF